LLAAALLACGDDEPLAITATPQPSATSAPTEAVAPQATAVPQPTQAPREVTGLFLEPRPSEPDRFVSVPPRPPSPFAPWDRESVVVYDVEAMTERNFGRGILPSFSPDMTRLAINAVDRPGLTGVRIVDFESGEVVDELEWSGGLASFVTDRFLSLGSTLPPREQVYDLERSMTRF
jgi:hypothetical protein